MVQIPNPLTFLPNFPAASDYVAGSYYGANTTRDGALTTIGVAANTIYLSYPILVRKSHTFDRLVIRQTTNDTGDKVRVGIWKDLGKLSPEGATLEIDSGELTMGGAAANHEATISWAAVPGVYYMGLVSDTASTSFLASDINALSGLEDFGVQFLRTAWGAWSTAFTYGVLSGADPLPDITGNGGAPPYIRLRG